MQPQPKSIFKSKTALAGALVTVAGALGSFAEPVSQFLSAHAPAILIAVGVLNVALRAITKGRVTLLGE